MSFTFTVDAQRKEEWKGYAWAAGSTAVKFVGWSAVMIATFVYCCGCALASAALWLCGVCSVIEWVWWRLTTGRRKYLKRKRREVPPGEERGKDWRKARDIARARNYAQNNPDSEHFNVAPLLKMTAGLDLADLSLRIKRKAEANHAKEDFGPPPAISSTAVRAKLTARP